MQDIHSIGVDGAGPQLYGGVGDSRRVRPNQQQASINCPRCDSPNTKFCYYNNYNLSQPRYYCKGCRRYWTKGGVLRNVPVGGGCRKGKRSVPKLSNNNVSTRIRKEVIVKSNSNCNTEITSTSAAVTVNPDIMPANSKNLPEFPELFKQQVVESTTKEEHIFKDVGSLANFMTSSISNDPNDINNMSIMYQKSNEQHKIEEMSLGLVGEKVELSGKNEGGLAPVDWQNGDHGLFGIDTAYNYWSQLTQWGENNYSLDYLP